MKKGFTMFEFIVGILVFSAMIFFGYKYFSSAPSEEAMTIQQEIDNR